MIDRASSLWGACALLLVGAAACEVDEEPRTVALEDVEAALSAELCDRMFACQCDQGQRYGSIEQCEQDAAQLAQALEAAPSQWAGIDLVYDPACLGAVVELFADVGCGATVPQPDQGACTPPCHYFHGTMRQGEPCQIYGTGLSDCVQGLQCSGGTCIDPCTSGSAQVGQPCYPLGCAEGLGCDFGTETCQPLPLAGQPCRDGACAEGLACDFDDATCKTLPPAGQPCLGGFECAEGLFCEAVDLGDPMSERLCFAPQGLGAVCRGHAQCQSGYCPASFCEPLPREGEACPASVCASDLDCIDGTCAPADAAICWASIPYF